MFYQTVNTTEISLTIISQCNQKGKKNVYNKNKTFQVRKIIDCQRPKSNAIRPHAQVGSIKFYETSFPNIRESTQGHFIRLSVTSTF